MPSLVHPRPATFRPNTAARSSISSTLYATCLQNFHANESFRRSKPAVKSTFSSWLRKAYTNP